MLCLTHLKYNIYFTVGYLSVKTTAYKNAEKHIKIAKTVTAYVIVFSICWLPQKIFMIVYIMQVCNVKTDYKNQLLLNFKYFYL